MGLPRLVPIVAASAGTAYALMESFAIYGGNVASTLAGEFSYSWSFSLGFLYLGLLIRVMDGESRLAPLAALAFAATALCHVLTTLVLIIGTLVLLVLKKTRRPLMVVSIWAFCLTGFWSVPLLANLRHSSDMAWYPLTDWRELLPAELWLLLPLALAGMFWAVRRGRRSGTSWKVLPLIAMTAVPAIYYPLPIKITQLLPDLFLDEHWKLWNGRLLPYWYFGVTFFALVGVGALITVVVRRLPRHLSPGAATSVPIVIGALVAVAFRLGDPPRDHAVPLIAGLVLGTVLYARSRPVVVGKLLAGLVALGVAVAAWSGVVYLPGWSEWNYSGYENKEHWGEYRDMNALVGSLEPGRVLWENSEDIGKYGTPMAPMLIPYWTDWTHPSLEGLYFESSLTMPFAFIAIGEMSAQSANPIPGLQYYNLDIDRGLRHLDMFGVDYYVSYTPEATDAAHQRSELREVGRAGPFHVYQAPATELVEVAKHEPSVYAKAPNGEPDFFNFSLAWFDALYLADLWVTAEAPPEMGWRQVSETSQLRSIPLPTYKDVVGDVEIADHRISFTTTAVGVPHLVKVSYFPNWNATGAHGPYLVAPSLMLVVPTDTRVVIEFQNTWAEWAGWAATAFGAIFLLVPRWRRSATRWASPPQTMKAVEGGDGD